MKVEEIKKGLECCSRVVAGMWGECGDCPYSIKGDSCQNHMLYDAVDYVKDLREQNKELAAINAISTLLDATRELFGQSSSTGGVFIKTGDLKETYSILIQKESVGSPTAALNVKIDALSTELGQAKAYIGGLESELANVTVAKATLETDKANLERTIEEMNEVLKANGITIDADGNVNDSRVEQAKKQAAKEILQELINIMNAKCDNINSDELHYVIHKYDVEVDE